MCVLFRVCAFETLIRYFSVLMMTVPALALMMTLALSQMTMILDVVVAFWLLVWAFLVLLLMFSQRQLV